MSLRALCLLALMLPPVLSGCGRAHSERPDWIIRSKLVFMAEDLSGERPALPREQFRLLFPYVAGDLYGPPTTGDFTHPVLGPDYEFEIDLNRTLAALLASLEPTDLHESYLHIEPPQARVARLTPLMLQADGIEPVGRLEWLEADSKRELFLLYLDRPASITGRTSTAGRTVRYAISAKAAGYIWVVRQSNAEEYVYTATTSPGRLLLAAMPVMGPGPPLR